MLPPPTRPKMPFGQWYAPIYIYNICKVCLGLYEQKKTSNIWQKCTTSQNGRFICTSTLFVHQLYKYITLSQQDICLPTLYLTVWFVYKLLKKQVQLMIKIKSHSKRSMVTSCIKVKKNDLDIRTSAQWYKYGWSIRICRMCLVSPVLISAK